MLQVVKVVLVLPLHLLGYRFTLQYKVTQKAESTGIL
jgi:hypothetical protein